MTKKSYNERINELERKQEDFEENIKMFILLLLCFMSGIAVGTLLW